MFDVGGSGSTEATPAGLSSTFIRTHKIWNLQLENQALFQVSAINTPYTLNKYRTTNLTYVQFYVIVHVLYEILNVVNKPSKLYHMCKGTYTCIGVLKGI